MDTCIYVAGTNRAARQELSLTSAAAKPPLPPMPGAAVAVVTVGVSRNPESVSWRILFLFLIAMCCCTHHLSPLTLQTAIHKSEPASYITHRDATRPLSRALPRVLLPPHIPQCHYKVYRVPYRDYNNATPCDKGGRM